MRSLSRHQVERREEGNEEGGRGRKRIAGVVWLSLWPEMWRDMKGNAQMLQ